MARAQAPHSEPVILILLIKTIFVCFWFEIISYYHQPDG